MKINPEERASVFSYATFWWINDTLKLGYQRPLQPDDLFPCHTAMRSKHLTSSLDSAWSTEKQRTKPSFAKAVIKAHKTRLFIITMVTILEAVFVTVPSYLVGSVSAYFEDDPSVTTRRVLIYSGVLCAMNVSYVFLRSMLFWAITRLSVAIRVSTSSLIYQKACNIRMSALGSTDIGRIINLITNDAERITDGYIPLHNVLHTPVTVTVAFVLLYFQIGVLPTVACFLSLAVFVPLQIYLGNLIKRCRNNAAPQTDKRVKLIGETITSMKVIKMYNWESTFLRIICKIRELEIRFIGICSLVVLSNNSIQTLSSLLALLVTLGVKYFRNESITLSQLYFLMSIIESLRNGVVSSLTNVSKFIPQFIHSTQRMQEFLAGDENDKENLEKERQPSPPSNPSNRAVVLRNVSSTWNRKKESFTLSHLNLEVGHGEHVGVIGVVGSGKSSLLATVAKEMDVVEGHVEVSDRIAYASQIPWIFSGTIQENILFNRDLDRQRLHDVIYACSLFPDLDAMPNGLDTLVGERGVQLSGGQKARVSLARAVYGHEELVLLDDPLSAVDTQCAHYIVKRLIMRFLESRTVLLVTHNTDYLEELDRIVVMREGHLVENGTWNEIRHRCSSESSDTLKEQESGVLPATNLSEVRVSEGKAPKNKVEEDRKEGGVRKSLYLKYWSLGFGPLALVLVFLAIAGGRTLKIFTDRMSIRWAEEKLDKIFMWYAILSLITMATYLGTSFFVVGVAMRASKRLHNKAIARVFKTSLRYFDTTPIGSLINRFSKDTYFTDERMVVSFSIFMMNFAILSASMLLMAIANYYFIFLILPIFVVIGVLTKFYLKTSVEVRRLEAMQRSPTMSHVSETLSGMSTIRSSNQLHVYLNRYFQLRDDHTTAYLVFMVVGRWLGQKLDLLLAILAFLANIAAIYLKVYNIISPNLAGLAVVYIQNSLLMFQCFIRQGADCENLMVSVERLFALTELPSEEERVPSSVSLVKVNKAVEQCHSTRGEGVIKFEEVSLRYDESLPWVLKDVTFTTKPAEKIGIVGPTGAGKSSILQALYRMCETTGIISIDGIVTSEISLHDLRSSLSVIPQESLLFSGTLRQNLDPRESYCDQKLWDVLEEVTLKDYVAGQLGGLDMEVEEMGRNLSVGQRQLVCLARALLKDCSVLVIDECTANVDQETDKLIQRMIREKFVDRTVLTIAHRLNTIIDSDRILVVKDGRIQEFDKPEILLQNKKSMFAELYHRHRQMLS